MKYKIVDELDSRINIFCYYDDGTYMNINLIGNRDMNDILKDAYIISSNPMNRSAFEGETPTDLPEIIIPISKQACPHCNMYHDCETMRALIDLVLWGYHD